MPRVRFLGSGDAFGSGGRLQTCIMVEHARGAFLLDCGATSMVAMRRAGVDPGSIDTVLLTHLHGDHFGGLPFLLLHEHLHARREKPLRIAGPPGTAERLKATQALLFPGSESLDWRFPLEFAELCPGRSRHVGGLAVRAFPADHPSGAPAFALRVAVDGKVVGYTGDTQWTDALLAAARGTDLFVAEALRHERAAPYHMTVATWREQRARLRTQRLVLTHMGPEVLERLDEVGREFDCASDGAVFEL